MASVKNHYSKLLSNHYSWMYGGFDQGLKNNTEFFRKHEIFPDKSALAIDLGAGCGFQSIPLAKSGFNVIAIDFDDNLLNELKQNSQDLQINLVLADIMDFERFIPYEPELVICMTDTILHLDSKQKVSLLFSKIQQSLENKGKFILTFRDLTKELNDLDRFIPIQSDENRIFTCFLEYEPETVKIHDIIHIKTDDKWQLFKSFYRKLRLSEEYVKKQLFDSGFKSIDSTNKNGMVTIIASV